MVSEDGVGDARWRPAVKAVESGGGAAGGFPSLAMRPLDQIRVCWWGARLRSTM